MLLEKTQGLQSSIPRGTDHCDPLIPHSRDGTSPDRTDVDNGESLQDVETAV